MFDSLPTWGPEFEMQVEIKINSWIDSWGSIFTFKAIDGNVGEIGQRIPGIWTEAGTNDSLYLSTHINDKCHRSTRINTNCNRLVHKIYNKLGKLLKPGAVRSPSTG